MSLLILLIENLLPIKTVFIVNKGQPSRKLREVPLSMSNWNDCQSILSQFEDLSPENLICAGNIVNGTDECQGMYIVQICFLTIT